MRVIRFVVFYSDALPISLTYVASFLLIYYTTVTCMVSVIIHTYVTSRKGVHYVKRNLKRLARINYGV